MGDKRYRAPIRSNIDNGQQWSGDMDAMHRFFEATKPQRVIEAGPVYLGVAEKFEAAAGTLRNLSHALAVVWKGDDAEAAIKQMQRLGESAESIRLAADSTGKALSKHGEHLDWYRTHQPKEGLFKGLTWDQAGFITGGSLLVGPGASLVGMKKAEALGIIKHTEAKAAVEHMQRLSGRAREANTAMPPEISTDIPKTGIYRRRPKPIPGGGPSGGGGLPGGGGGLPGGGMPGGGGSLPGGFDGVGNSGGGAMHGGGYGGGAPGGSSPGSDLAGLSGGSGGAGADPFGRGGGVPGGGGGGMPGGGGGGLPGGGPGGIAGGMPSTGTGAGKGSGGGAKGLGKSGGGARGGMGGAPMGGRGGGKGEEDHERTTWLTEDEDVWGGNDDDASPPVIG